MSTEIRWTAEVVETHKSGAMVKRGDVISLGNSTGVKVAKITESRLPAPYGGTTTVKVFLDDRGDEIGRAGRQGSVPVLVARLTLTSATKTTKEG